MKTYTEEELIKAMFELPSFNGWPKGDFLLGIRSKEDKYNEYDDMFYQFRTDTFHDGTGLVTRPILIRSYTGTTNSGSYGFLNWRKWSKVGVGLIKSNEWYYDVWRYGLHKGRMRALLQVGPFKIIRRKSVDDKNTQWSWERNKGFNFHTNTYATKFTNWLHKLSIDGWSVGCQVSNNPIKYYETIDDLEMQKGDISYVLLDEV